MPKSARPELVAEALSTWQLQSLAGKSMRALSVGQRRRVDLARAFMGRPRILILDEPFAALDAQFKQLARDRIDEAGKRAVVLISEPEVQIRASATVSLESRP
jgi:ABC-type multidrug transport system ATPase subunit